MIPKIVCTHCGTSLAGTEKFCPSCGVAVDWAEGITSPSVQIHRNDPVKKEQRGLKRESSAWSPKSIVGALFIIAVAVIAYELLIRQQQSTVPVSPGPEQSMQAMGGNPQMQVELQALESRVLSHPSDMASTLQLANLLQDGASYEKAVTYYSAYLVKYPDDANARVDMGICYKELGKLPEAKKEMMEALKYVPKHLNAHFNLGIVCLTEGNIQESNEWFKKTAALDPASEVGKRAQQLLIQHNSQSQKTK